MNTASLRRRSSAVFAGPLLVLAVLAAAPAGWTANVLVEAESFTNRGGWELDTQFIHVMGSPYLLAHGLGEPVADASTTVTFPKTGTYRVFVRTKDWVAAWNAPGKPGRFQLIVEGTPLKETFGTRFADWMWHPGGTVEIKKERVQIALHDLTGFDGRCDAILFTDDASITVPPNDSAPLAVWRKAMLHLPATPAEAGSFDLVVVGGGYAGMCAALSAARMGCKVALIQDRPVFGGNGSSEIRVWPQGLTRRGLFPRVGEMVEELVDRPEQSPGPTHEFDDAKREAILRAEKNLSVFLNHHVFQVETNGNRLAAVLALDTRTSAVKRFAGKLFVDCTGHGTVGCLAGAHHTTQEKGHMGMSNMWRWRNTDAAQSFPPVPWALNLAMKDFPYPKNGRGEWFWESGFDADPVRDLEYVRDWNLRAVFGAFSSMKNGEGKAQHLNAKLEWVAYVGGTRESRQLLGDVVLSKEDIVAKKQFPDGCVPTTWDIDLHYAQEKFTNAYPQNPFISRAEFGRHLDKARGYPVPYRCFYSRNVENLFTAGRCISVTHEALGTVRVQKTTGMMGEVVGKAASLCVKHNRLPADIYPSHWEEMRELLNLPGAARRDTVNDAPIVPAGVKPLPPPEVISIDPAQLDGLVIDDAQARRTGNWQFGQGLRGYVGEGYHYLGPKNAGAVRYEFSVKESGRYEVRLSYQPHANRASNARVTVNVANGARTQRVNQCQAPPLKNGFVSLGVFDFEAGQPGSVVLDTDGTDGTVAADAVQVVRKE
ncbi:MAG: FAD-dependent oxidoreductase [Verrucomicrobia bacterium]|nr:FAD-dependent oxidoreductase [Verrucomicrobiota bacterium]